ARPPKRFRDARCWVTGFRICSFNVQSFGETKAANQEVMSFLVKILSRCDICLVMEVRDLKILLLSDPTVISNLSLSLSLWHRFDRKHQYVYTASERLGHSSYREQYVFIYRSDVVTVEASYQYREGESETLFTRPPLVVRFHSPRTAIKRFVLICQHTAPGLAVKEIDHLFDVFVEVRTAWDTEDIMLLGDFNAGCRYVPAGAWDGIRLRRHPGFRWLIRDSEDTTVRAHTHCAYDRIVVHGHSLSSAIVPGSAKCFDFKTRFNLTEAEVIE
uniref:Deoxyribonuclease n=1 Tax=Callorhinchus milii TaxID=7868 RepID=A0A4W3GLM7_CALMI